MNFELQAYDKLKQILFNSNSLPSSKTLLLHLHCSEQSIHGNWLSTKGKGLYVLFLTFEKHLTWSITQAFDEGGTALEWMRSYLSSRTQFVSFCGCGSSKKEMTYGLPQGSVLGPTLFNLHINGITSVCQYCYRKIPKISPGAYIFHWPFLRGLFLEGLIFGGASLRRDICVYKSIRLAL